MEGSGWILIVNFVTVVASLGTLCLLFRQVRLLTQQIADDHERSRREKSLQLLAKWADFVNEPGGTAPANFAQRLSIEQTDALVHSREFAVSEKLKSYLEIWLENIGDNTKLERCSGESVEYIVTKRVSALIRRRVASYLNNLEVIMEAKRHQVADARILHDQFCHYVNLAEKRDLLAEFRRRAAGESGFPGISAFVESIKDGTTHVASHPTGRSL
jgi:hypothetical protein